MTFKLILLRHGQSTWNEKNLFTGWKDVGITQSGRTEAIQAGALLKRHNHLPDVSHTSLLRRAITSGNIALDTADRHWIPVTKSWRLNERHYGALQGLNKKATAEKYGDEQVKIWRRSYDIQPPPMSDHAYQKQNEYTSVQCIQAPRTESLKDVVARVEPYWKECIIPDLKSGKTVLVAAHGNSLRALVKIIDGLGDDEVVELDIPTGTPIVYELDDSLRPVVKGGKWL
ncbi:2 3-bisphosphoglycerate-dependent phosphoglycerate mutase [Fusarium tjaetaba]|uniref:Phosphoglycerate mutase n=1 Tax=Fusarium tjaetaba TaxID=1567544 RepID=A0A8H5VSS6_9HYPO|nr:2 3-bisphosphoglycerate-dependent phosphoglycerate mutase [Fusarium tjaetaba]KAF5633138.1 2 3-bisphosphoglycerate-dependent phosphoglycerate mutase [Fusarium tjaetaba]